MVRQLEAVYEEGVLRPLEPLPFKEHQRVKLTVDDQQAATTNGAPSEPVDRRAELQWIANHASRHAGQWVAIHGDRLLASGTDAASVRAAARAAGVERPILTHIPADPDELPFAGW